MRNIETRRKSHDHANGASQTLDGEATPTGHLPGVASPPATPTPQTFQTETLEVPQPKVTIPDLLSTSSERLAQRESLTSSRPAPPSPAASRRTSAALSRHSSYARSRPQSRVTSLSQSTLPMESQPTSEHQAEASSSTVVPPKRRSLLMKIRDFAFPVSDDRHSGKGSDVPRPNRPRYRGSVYSTSSSSADEEGLEAEEDQQRSSWSSFRWNTLSQHFWGSKRAEGGPQEAGPSRTDFDRNFETSSPADEISEPDYSDEDVEEYPETIEDEPLVPGTYRALYAFEPEGTAEMALEEEQVVHVIGRGGGVGWAVVDREGGGHALVPESYLELIRADEGPEVKDA
ncbi:hypothetical protein BDW22DRAFT_1488495 [Trametopsis cervina]|nr:hypothetical protein BDW22DRAFT_1488495 [Trametopsis cervina]